MKVYNRVFALILIVIAGLTGGIVLSYSWRLFALCLISVLTLIYGLSFWRATLADVKYDSSKGFLRIKLHWSIFLPILSISLGAAMAGWLYQVIILYVNK